MRTGPAAVVMARGPTQQLPQPSAHCAAAHRKRSRGAFHHRRPHHAKWVHMGLGTGGGGGGGVVNLRPKCHQVSTKRSQSTSRVSDRPGSGVRGGGGGALPSSLSGYGEGVAGGTGPKPCPSLVSPAERVRTPSRTIRGGHYHPVNITQVLRWDLHLLDPGGGGFAGSVLEGSWTLSCPHQRAVRGCV